MSIRKLTLSAMFVALITIGAFIRIPVGSNVFTLQLLFTLLAGLILGARLGAFTVSVYVFAGLIGLPVFASGGGLSYFLQPTFGYLPAFILQAAFCGFFIRRLKPSFKNIFIVNLIGLLIVYVMGTSWFYLATNFLLNTDLPIATAIFYCVVVQVPADVFICAVAAFCFKKFNETLMKF